MTRTLAARAAAIIVILLASSIAQAAVEDLTDVVPAGAPIVLYVADVPGALDQWAESPAAELWNDPQVKTFFAPLREGLEVDDWDRKVRKETGYGLDEIMAMFTGDLVLYLESIDFDFDHPDDDPEVSIAIMATLGDSAEKFEKLILEQEEKSADAAEDDLDDDGVETIDEIRDFRGVDLHLEVVMDGDAVTDEFGWAVVDGVVVFASPGETLENAVAGILDRGLDDPLRTGANFATVSRHTRNADAWFFLDVEPWVPLLRQAVAEGLAAAQAAGSPFPVDPAILTEALGIESMQAIFATVDLDDSTIAMDLGATFTENRGLIKLLAYGPQEAPRVAYIPVDSDSFSAATFDFGAAWSALEDIVNGINPALMGMAAMQLQSMVSGAGAELDLGRDLLDNLTGEMVSIQNLDGVIGDSIADIELRQDQVVVLGIEQRDALENAIETIKALAGQGSQFFTERDFQGTAIFTLDLPQTEGEAPGPEIAYAVTDRHLWISMGTSATLEKALLKLADKGESVWKLPVVKRSLARLPQGAAAVQYQDLTKLGDVVFRAAAVAGNIDTEDEDGFRLCDPSAIPEPGTFGRYLSSGVSGVWKDDRSLVIRALLLPADRD